MKHVGKGSILRLTISNVLTAVEQVMDLDIGQHGIELVDAGALDDPSPVPPRARTGRTTPADISGNMYYDPGSARHQLIDDEINDPSDNVAGVAGEIELVDGSTIDFTAIGFQAGESIKQNDLLKRAFTIQTNGLTRTPAV